MGPGAGGGSALGSMLAGSAGAMQGGAAGGGPDSGLQALMGQIRQIGQMVQQLEGTVPVLAEEAQQINALLKQMVVKAAQAQGAQTASGMAVPGGGGM